MDTNQFRKIKTLVQQALLLPEEERPAFLARECCDNAELRAEVERLLAQPDDDDDLGVIRRDIAEIVEFRNSGRPSRTDPADEAAPGDREGRIGPYRLLEKVGEGGMGEVWVAEQTEPFRRRVALKLIKRGMDSDQILARFEAERQALAMMEHAAIARVFDAGQTPSGRPYFAMEYIDGVPINEYCDRHKLLTRERLDLFVKVCEGVQHAHQKAVIHRDLKPSNILVAQRDGQAEPKIIDFGVAKATAQRLTERTMFTEMGVLIGTPEYMSPEQAELSGQNIDTRSDVYSLGVLLYELITGALPFSARELRKAGFDEIRRQIREVDPLRPSMRLSTLGEKSADAAQKRQTEPAALTRQIRGDLDWITMKALEKDRARRYGSPSDLAMDIGRYLVDEPVQAGPPGTFYRMRKFVRRHRIGVTAAAAALIALVAFTGTVTVQAKRIAVERDRANREAEISKRSEEFLISLFEVSAPSKSRGNSVTAIELLEEGTKQIERDLAGQPEVRASLMAMVEQAHDQLGLERPDEESSDAE